MSAPKKADGFTVKAYANHKPRKSPRTRPNRPKRKAYRGQGRP